MNIGRHEVAFSSLPLGEPDRPPQASHALVMDSLVRRDRQVLGWLKERDGSVEPASYASALRDSVSIRFVASFEDALGVFRLDGVRRALIAYWFDALLGMRQRGSRSLFAQRHNYSAVASIMEHLRQMRRFRQTLHG